MKTLSRLSLPLVLALGAVLGLSACNLIPPATPDTTRYYVLTALPPKPTALSFSGAHSAVLLRPVEVASFLRGKAMQVRSGGNEVHFVEDARWAETLEAGLGRVLRESLEGRGAVSHVVSSPAEDHAFEITVRVLECGGDRDAKLARFTAAVEIYLPGAGSERRTRDTFTVEVPKWDGSYGQLAAKLSEAVDGLADRIAELVEKAGKQ
jgi:uncharacterized lipoprotein YmbA